MYRFPFTFRMKKITKKLTTYKAITLFPYPFVLRSIFHMLSVLNFAYVNALISNWMALNTSPCLSLSHTYTSILIMRFFYFALLSEI